jgi:pimeloyl-ACP methyl ester carboxylesterase
MIRQGKGPPLVLLHGILGSETMWHRVVPLVAPHHDTIALTALGHRGGRPATRRPALLAHLVDDVAHTLDELRIERAHFAGNSLGGWMSLELARRGRALSVCALSPAGCWPPPADGEQGRDSRPAAALKAAIRDIRMGRPLVPFMVRSSRFRRWAMRLNAVHGDRLRPEEMVKMADDVLGCTVGGDLLRTGEALAPLDPLPCPVVVAWSERDRLLPLKVFGTRAKELMPAARFTILPGVGHVPMFDSPELVAKTILESTAAHAA